MQASLKKISVAALAALSIAAATVATSSSATARPFHGGFHHGGFHHGGFHRGGFHHGRFHRGFGPAFVGGLAFAAPYAGYYYDDCAPRRRVVGYTPWGRPIVRLVSVCY